MANPIATLLETTKQRMGGYSFLFKYRLIHFSVKADPAVMLAVVVEVDGEEHPIEEVAQVVQPDDFKLMILPRDNDFVLPICEAILRVQPEYKLERTEIEREPQSKPDLDEDDLNIPEPEEDVMADLVKPIVITCHMPEVNEDRKDAGMDYVKINFDVAMAKLDTCKSEAAAGLAKLMLNSDEPQKLDTFMKEVDKMYDQHKSICENQRKEKEEEIAEAYQAYMEEKVAKQAKEMREQAARGEMASQSIQLDPFLLDD